ncbi:MAG: hypothetical protein ACLUVF_10335 [Adlercreutzia sp.]
MTADELAALEDNGLPHLRQLLGHTANSMNRLCGRSHRASGQRHRAGRLPRADSSAKRAA